MIHDIAIIGIAGIFPDAPNVQCYWDNLLNGIESISRFSKVELARDGLIDLKLLDANNFVAAKAYLEDACLFASETFGLNEKKSKITDPQFRLFLECIWQAFSDAGYHPKKMSSTVGVYSSSSTQDSYYQKNLADNPNLLNDIDPYELLTSNAKDFMATLAAYCLDFKGPCLNIQTACSSSLVAVCQACDDLSLGKCDLAIAGGMSVSFPLKNGYLYKPGMIFSEDGHCRAFSADANGIVGGNGGGVVLLKKLSDAKRDGDYIYASIKGYAINNDGHNKLSYNAPSIEGQERVLLAAAKAADISPHLIQYIEAHGTGTRLGDQIEIAALKKYLSSSKQHYHCYLGSVKSNIGHLDVAAGIASLLKTALAIKHGKIPATLHCAQANPELTDSQLKLTTATQNWPVAKVRYAGVSSFGIGGTNAHLILSSVDSTQPKKSRTDMPLSKRKLYYIPPAKTYHPDIPQLLSELSWIADQAPANNKISQETHFIILQDTQQWHEEIFNYLANEYCDAEIELVAQTQQAEKKVDAAWMEAEQKQWQKILSNNKQQATTIIFPYLESNTNINDHSILNTHFYRFIALAKAISALDFNLPLKLIIISNKLCKVLETDLISPLSNILLGPLFCLPIEYSTIDTKAIDIGTQVTRKNLLATLEQELNIDDQQRLVAYRNNTRQILAFKAVKNKQNNSAIQLKKHGVYLFTGGLGGVALTLANYLAQHYQANLILLSKNSFPTEDSWQQLLTNDSTPEKTRNRIRNLLAIKKHSKHLLVKQADVSDRKKLLAIIKQTKQQVGEVNGIIHAASTYPTGLTKNKTLLDIHNMLNSKISGLLNLVSACKSQSLDFMLLCSALNTYTGAVGAIDYVAANAFMDAYAKSEEQQSSYPIISVNWGAWQEAGMFYESQQQQRSEKPFSFEKNSWKALLAEHRFKQQLIIPGSMLIETLLRSINKQHFLANCLNSIAFINMARYSNIDTLKLKIKTEYNEIKIYLEENLICQAIKDKSVSSTTLDQNLLSKLKSSPEIKSNKKNASPNINLGEHWQCLQWTKRLGKHYLALIKLPEKFQREIQDYYAHAALLDMAYSFYVRQHEGQYLPYYIDQLKIHEQLPSKLYSLAEVTPLKDKTTLRANITLFDKQENIIAEITGICLRKLHNTEPHHAKEFETLSTD